MSLHAQGHIGPFPKHLLSLALHPNGSLLAGGFDDGVISLWAADTHQLVGTMRVKAKYAHIYDLAFHPDGAMLASASDDGSVRLWDVATTREIARLAPQRPAEDAGPEAWEQWDAFNPHTLAFSPDGDLLVCGQLGGGVMKVWNIPSGVEQSSFAGHPGRLQALPYPESQTNAPLQRASHVSALAFSPDGKVLLSGSHDNTIGMWDRATRHGDRIASPHTYSVDAIALHPSGLYAVSGGCALVPYDQSPQPTAVLHVWTVPHMGLQTSVSVDVPFILSLAFTAEGTVLASGDAQGQILLWDTATWTTGDRAVSAATFVSDLVWSPDDTCIWSRSWWTDRHQSIVERWQYMEREHTDCHR